MCGAPRVENALEMALCADHVRAYQNEAARRSRERQAGSYAQEYRRLCQYVRAAQDMGATDDQAWWCAVAANAAYNAGQGHPHWLTPFIAAELDYLRANEAVFDRLDARQWEPIAGDEVGQVEDDGYEIDQEVA